MFISARSRHLVNMFISARSRHLVNIGFSVRYLARTYVKRRRQLSVSLIDVLTLKRLRGVVATPPPLVFPL